MLSLWFWTKLNGFRIFRIYPVNYFSGCKIPECMHAFLPTNSSIRTSFISSLLLRKGTHAVQGVKLAKLVLGYKDK